MEAKAWSSAEVDAALWSSFEPVREESENPEETRNKKMIIEIKDIMFPEASLFFSFPTTRALALKIGMLWDL